jgi:1,4-dihydroxy-2-naphthoate polyprenyltransferase
MRIIFSHFTFCTSLPIEFNLESNNMNKMLLKTILLTTRPSFLVLTPVCIFLGLSTTLAQHVSVSPYLVFLILIGAISAHISVNTLNEFGDFKSGLDLKTVKTPFSGGSGALPHYPEAAQFVLILGLGALLITIVIGIYLLLVHGSLILPIGIVGVALIVLYTQWINRFPFLCLLAPGLGFGLLMVVGTHLVITGEHSPLVWLVSLVPFFLINNLLLLNQYPDMEADASTGRRTFPIAYGTTISNVVYAIFAVLSYGFILYSLYMRYIPTLSVMALTPAAASLYALLGAIKHASNIGSYPQYLAANVAAAILTPLLLAIALSVG